MTDEQKSTEEKPETKGVVKSEARMPIDINLTSGIMPHSYNEMLQFARLYKESGLAPKSFETVQQVAIGIGMCMEVGRPILTGLQDMAVINGRVGVYGDAVLAIIRASGLLEEFDQWEEGTEYTDAWVVHTKVRRKGYEVKTDRWSWLDSKRAGFDNPMRKDGSTKDMYSPWRRFTRRMMYFKSRNFLLRDEFGDLLKGMKPVEELQEIIDVTPDEGNAATDLNEKLKGKPGAKTEIKTDLYKTKEPEKKEDKKEETVAKDREVDAIRKLYKGLGDPNFRKFMESCKDEIPTYPKINQDEIEASWRKRFKDEPYPVSEEPKTPIDPDPTLDLAPEDPKVTETDETEGDPGAETPTKKILRLVTGAKFDDTLDQPSIPCPQREKRGIPSNWCLQSCNDLEDCKPWAQFTKDTLWLNKE